MSGWCWFYTGVALYVVLGLFAYALCRAAAAGDRKMGHR